MFPPNVYPLYVPGMLESLGAANPGMRSWLGAVQDGNASVRSIDRPAIAPLHPNRVFGHFLMEMVPKILLLDQCCPKNWPVAAAAFPSWLRPILEMLMPWREIVWYDPNKEIVKAPRFVTSTQFIHGEQIHPDFRSLLEMAKARIVMSSGEWTSETRRKIYISRSKAEVDWHKIENESEIERALQGIGFEVVHPQLMSFADQVRTFDAASIVVGEYSSAMHNAVFCRPGTVVVCLNWINDYQSRIASLFGHTIGFIKPTGNEFKDSSQWGKGMQLLHFSTHRVLKYVSRALPAAAP